MKKFLSLILLFALAFPCLLPGQSHQDRQQAQWLSALTRKEGPAIQQLWKLSPADLKPAIPVLAQQEEQAPEDPDWPYYLAIVCERTEDFEAAIRHYSRTDELHPSRSVRMRIARCHDALCQWDKAIEITRSLLETDDADEATVRFLASCQYKSADPAAALATLDSFATQPATASAECCYEMGLCHEALAQDESARACFQQALKLNPGYTPAVFALARSLMRHDEVKKGLMMIKDAVGKSSGSKKSYSEAPLLLLYVGRAEDAESKAQLQLLTQQAAGRNTAEARYTLARLYAQMGFKKRASFYLGQAIQCGYNNFYGILHDAELDQIREDDFFLSTMRHLWPDCLSNLAPFDPEPVPETATGPKFEGKGPNHFSQWVNARLVYPKECQIAGIQGDVILYFCIDTDGTLTDLELLESPHPALAEEAIRVVRSSPKWTPATKDGEPVRYTYLHPVYFRLR